MKRLSLFLYLSISILMFLQGCSSGVVKRSTDQTPFSELGQLFKIEKVSDARFQHVAGYDFFQITLPMRYQIERYDQLDGLQLKKHFVSRFMLTATKAGEQATSLALTRLAPEKIIAFQQDHPDIKNALDTHQSLMSVYRQQMRNSLKNEYARVEAIATESDLDQYWSIFIDGIEESIMTKDRLKRQLKTFYAGPFTKMWITYHEFTDYRGPVKADFIDADKYSMQVTEQEHFGVTDEDWRLLQNFSPTIVQEIHQDASYKREDDQFGEVSLQGASLEDAIPLADTDKPTIYAYVSEKNIQGSKVKQLVYTFFHPEHPKLSRFDPEAGSFDGWTVRISLDRNNQPLVYESVSNCGCYYKIFPTTRLEKLAHQSYSKKLKDKQFFVENIVPHKYDAVVPELVEDSGNTGPSKAIFYYSAGDHQLATIRSRTDANLVREDYMDKTYALHSYDELENLPFNGHRASLFGIDGLVRKAHRPECTLLASSGVYHAGHPRQRETQMIYFDDARFDDPVLLETYLRLPPDVFGLKK